jgi:hypothetical protein
MSGGVAQAIECLLCNCKALDSNHNPTKNQKKKQPRKRKNKLEREVFSF